MSNVIDRQGRKPRFVRQVDQVRKRAYELARSGRHIDCLTIESELEQEGYAMARLVLKDEGLRHRLRRICDRHWHPQFAPDPTLRSLEDGFNEPSRSGPHRPCISVHGRTNWLVMHGRQRPPWRAIGRAVPQAPRPHGAAAYLGTNRMR